SRAPYRRSASHFYPLNSTKTQKNEWQNRNRIRTAQGWQWVTVPVLHDFGQLIQDVRINQTVDWRSKHVQAFYTHYGRQHSFRQYSTILEDLYSQKWTKLFDITLALLSWLLKNFGIQTPMKIASEMVLREDPTDRLIDICQNLGATSYLAGPGTLQYMDFEKFEQSGVDIEFQDFVHPDYEQAYQPFVPTMSAFDLLFTHGAKSLSILRETRRPPKSMPVAQCV
ncbi:MAG: WbqC family protein, partial [Nitrospinae bacterium]|nr:WbqC family protein [Nitrospinota bacterium]